MLAGRKKNAEIRDGWSDAGDICLLGFVKRGGISAFGVFCALSLNYWTALTESVLKLF